MAIRSQEPEVRSKKNLDLARAAQALAPRVLREIKYFLVEPKANTLC